MRKSYYFLFILLICSLRAVSQELAGKISDSDSAGTALYQAVVTQSQAGKTIATYKTYFDGTYHVKVKPNQIYQLTASYPGRKDSTVSIAVDRNGTLIGGTVLIALKKNGLRLMGYVLDRDEDLPIKDAGIVVRNVMTRREEKYFTDVNGYYNLKMDFETNYTFKIDKRSPGIINKFQDTSFNISTIGFNQPLDFRFDIKLGPAEGFIKARPQYDPYAKPENKNLKPVVEVIGKRDTAKLREQAAALAELNKKLNSKDSAIAAISKKIEDINQTRKDEKTAANIEDQKKKTEAAKQKEEQEKADAALRAKELAEKERKAKEDADKRKGDEVRQAQLKKDQETALAEAKRKEQEKADSIQKAKQLAAEEQKAKRDADKQREEEAKQALLKLEKERKEQLAADQKKKDEETLLAKKQAENAAKNNNEQARIDKETEAIRRADSVLLANKLKKEQKAQNQTAKKEAEQIKPENKAEIKETIKVDQLPVDRETAMINRADSMLLANKHKKNTKDQNTETAKSDHARIIVVPSDSVMTDKQRKQQKESDLAKMKEAREKAEAAALVERRDREAKEKLTKKESRRLAKELAEQARIRKRADEQERKLTEEKLRIAAKKTQADMEQRELEAKKAHEEQEKKNLISQREKLMSNQQVRVARDDEGKEPYNNSATAVQEGNQKRTITDYETKVKDENRKKADTTGVIVLNAPRAASTKVVTTKGFVKNGQTEDPLSNVSINIRRINGLVSQEVTSDDNGNYQFQVDSGYFYLVSFYKDKYEISKQILDLTSYSKSEYTMLIQYLKEHDEFDPAAKMPVIKFEKNSSKLPDGVWSDLEAIVKMMQEIPQLKMKIYGLGSADEDYPMELSITRARMVADLMLESGIKPARIRINGIGPFRPRSGCVEGKECTQEQYQMDRVVLYTVIKE